MRKFEILKQKIEEDGWNIENVELPSHSPWAYEIWKLTSIWSPKGTEGFLMLQLDPMPDEGKTLEEQVSSLVLSNKLTTYWNDGHLVFIKPKWERGLTEFMEVLSEFRKQL
jgi:hypothetical protein